jgi:gluconolactonase
MSGWAGIEILAEGLLIPEGPVALPDGSLVIVEVGCGLVHRIGADGRREILAETGGGPNGAALGADGRLYLCNNGGGYACAMTDGRLSVRTDMALYVGGSIQRVDLHTGAVETLFSAGRDCEKLVAPNDLVFDSQGGLWFTDHGRSWGPDRAAGAIYYLPAGGEQAPRKVIDGLVSPNGIGLSRDCGRLYWSDTASGALWGAEVEGPGKLASLRVKIGSAGAGQRLDSLAVQEDGRVCVGTIGEGGITRFAAGAPAELIPLPDPMVTNICFGGEDRRDAFVTAAGTGRVVKLRWPEPGAALAF